MVRGRKPKEMAQRRGGMMPAAAEIIERPALVKPPHIIANPLMSDMWDALVAGSRNFMQEDVPLLDAYCFWYSVYQQAMNQTITPDGRVRTIYGMRDTDGKLDVSSVRANPDIQTAKKATEMMMRLAAVLQMTPEARGRAGLVSALTKSTQADVVNKTLAGYAEFKRLGGGA